MNQLIQDHLTQNDKVLKAIINKTPFPDINSTHNVFHDLMSCIIEQQIHYRSTKKTFQKIMDAASLKKLSVQNFSILEEKGLQNVKLSRQKYETILSLVDFFEQHDIDWQQQDDKEVRKILSQIKGIGTWTIDMILLYTLERQNIFPAEDYHLRLIMTKLYDIDTSVSVKIQSKEISEHWSPYKSMAVRYLLAWKKIQKIQQNVK
jgi:DNA-3-methyladenine glycosylase II